MAVTPSEAVESYLTNRQSDLSASSLQNHRYQLKRFREWCDGPGGVHKLEDLDPIDVSRFRRHRSDSINSNTMYNQLNVLRLFLRFSHRMGWVDESLPDSIVLPTRSGQSRDTSIDPDRAMSILDDLERFAYASRDHVIFALGYTCAFRIGALRAIDVKDVHLDERYVELVHRPETGTPLKNGAKSQREVNLHGWVVDVLRAWIGDRRTPIIDSHGRNPLVVTSNGRIARSSIRRAVYRLTACGGIDTGCVCDASRGSRCPDSVAPHDIRRSSISAWLDKGHEPELVGGRCDVLPKTIRTNYDVRSEAQKRELRRDAFDL